MSIDRTVNLHVSYVQMKVWWVMYSTGVCYVWDMAWGEKNVLVLVLNDVYRRPECNSSKREWAGCEGVQSDFLSPFPHSGGVKFLEAGQRGTDNPLSCPDCPL